MCPGQPGWAGTRRNIHPLTLIVVINHPYLLSPSTTIQSRDQNLQQNVQDHSKTLQTFMTGNEDVLTADTWYSIILVKSNTRLYSFNHMYPANMNVTLNRHLEQWKVIPNWFKSEPRTRQGSANKTSIDKTKSNHNWPQSALRSRTMSEDNTSCYFRYIHTYISTGDNNSVHSTLKAQNSRNLQFSSTKITYCSNTLIDKKPYLRCCALKFRLQCDTEVYCTVLSNTVIIKAGDRLPSSTCL